MHQIIKADFNNAEHGIAIITLLDEYAQDIMGGNAPLSEFCKANLLPKLAKRSDTHCLLAYHGDTAVGLAICIEGFSTFACQPLLNLHDLCVSRHVRGQGIGRKLLEHVKQLAQQLDCCKVTLEVLEGNRLAFDLYLDCGFKPYALDPQMGSAQMMQHVLTRHSH